ncbi:uncharacterized protein MONOS_4620 [Monocercomonoides exilis]|uniref:uncharacterized protein n=1 Tax=Monocercomonoides exilis TaxID=2049356 RepID=UPI00355A9664|nr:hypothetical protein MONOS_4620 [Monocercomonoides exilis]|eukprot:MONOS_4620.1-p1 / transcript=MONOS_4620.1 / gene=MONOS_4620 / organism=Monocercomonoides_exilis_PA203 / gene_product=unspecified product / transcript_product=unspecified product / location=Mono_scaffold00124:111182-111876(+) / protein_length=137 / sequence_SO=supercontig / SO=protein_coding / is_pseudo=false
MDRRLVGEGEKEEEEEGDGDDGDEMRNEEEVNKDDLYADANVEKVITFDNMLLNPSLLYFTRIVRGIPSEKEEMVEGREGGEEGEGEEDMFNKEIELGLIMSMDNWVRKKDSVAEDVEVMGFGEVPVRTEVEDNWA